MVLAERALSPVDLGSAHVVVVWREGELFLDQLHLGLDRDRVAVILLRRLLLLRELLLRGKELVLGAQVRQQRVSGFLPVRAAFVVHGPV